MKKLNSFSLILIFLVSVFSSNVFSAGLLKNGVWSSENNHLTGKIELCVSNDNIFYKRKIEGKLQKFSATRSDEINIGDVVILSLNHGKRTMFKIVAVKRGRDENVELIGSLHSYMNGLVHSNTYELKLSYQNKYCTNK